MDIHPLSDRHRATWDRLVSFRAAALATPLPSEYPRTPREATPEPRER